MRLEDLLCSYAKPEKKLLRSELEREVICAYQGHLEAEATMYCCDADALDKILGGCRRFVSIVESCYDYAVEGHLKTSNAVFEGENWLDFAAFISKARRDAEIYGVNTLTLKLERLFKIGAIRARLDCDTIGDAAYDSLPEVLRNEAVGWLSLTEIAFLACMTEKAVRNAAQPTVEDRLVTRKEGSRTVVDSHEALRWLGGRRNFVPTQLV